MTQARAYDISAAQRLTLALGGSWNSTKGKALCPYHDDHDPSLDIKAGRTRDVIAYCQACGPVFDRLVEDGKVPGRSSAPIKPTKPVPPAISEAEYNFMRLRDAMKILRSARQGGEQPTEYLAARGIN